MIDVIIILYKYIIHMFLIMVAGFETGTHNVMLWYLRLLQLPTTTSLK